MATFANITRVGIILPLSILVLYFGHQKWRRQRSFATVSHSDIFTYHLVVMELIWILGVVSLYCGYSIDLPEVSLVGSCACSLTFYGQTFFHILTCVERYLAVVHPITYLELRSARGVRIRNISTGCVWLLCFGLLYPTIKPSPSLPNIHLFCLLVFSLAVVSFCSLSVLRALLVSGPRAGGGDQGRVDQSKKRTFLTILVITGVLCLWFVGLFVSSVLQEIKLMSTDVSCLFTVSVAVCNIPSSVTLPLLYLRKRMGQ